MGASEGEGRVGWGKGVEGGGWGLMKGRGGGGGVVRDMGRCGGRGGGGGWVGGRWM